MNPPNRLAGSIRSATDLLRLNRVVKGRYMNSLSDPKEPVEEIYSLLNHLFGWLTVPRFGDDRRFCGAGQGFFGGQDRLVEGLLAQFQVVGTGAG